MSAISRDVHATLPAAPRPLTLRELHTLTRLGFGEQADRLSRQPCPDCGGHPLGVLHKDTCRRKPSPPVPVEISQPWQPRPVRSQRAA